MVSFRPLGAPEAGFYQSILEIENCGIKILVDVGWDAFLQADLTAVEAQVPSLNLILLTHADISHLGAYCYLCKSAAGFAEIPTYATLPVATMGRVATFDSYRSRGLTGPFPNVLLSTQDIEQFFNKIQTVNYSQPLVFHGQLDSIQITAFNSGHTLGGTIWKISDSIDTILYAVDWNHARDGHLNGAFLELNGLVSEQLTKPGLMITSSSVSSGTSLKTSRMEFLQCIETTVANGGSVLIPSSIGSRVLELCLFLDYHFAQKDVSVPLFLLSHSGHRILSYAGSMLEWMQSSIVDDWHVKNDSPFATNKIKCLTSMEQLLKYGGPKVIIASGSSLESGFSKLVFAKMASEKNFTLILTEFSPPRSLGGIVHSLWKNQTRSSKGLSSVTCEIPNVLILEETELTGQELLEYNAKLEEKRRNEVLRDAWEKRNLDILAEKVEASDDDDDDEDVEEKILGGQVDLNVFLSDDPIHDYNLRSSSGKIHMFPWVPNRRPADDYGKVLSKGEFEKSTEVPGGQSLVTAEKVTAKEKSDEELALGLTRGWATEVPTKEKPLRMMSNYVNLKILCQVNYVDFNGLVDIRSLSMVLGQIKPKKLIVLPGDKDVLKVVQKLNISYLEGNRFLDIPRTNFSLNVKISPELEASLLWQRVHDRYTIAHVSGKLKFTAPVPQEGAGMLGEDQKMETELIDENQSSVKYLKSDYENKEEAEREAVTIKTRYHKTAELWPSDVAESCREPIFIGDIRLSELKRKLAQAGYQAEFCGEGMLVCNRKVAVRKITEGELIIEGGISSEFDVVRRTIVSLLAVI